MLGFCLHVSNFNISDRHQLTEKLDGRYANVPLGSPCVVDEVKYADPDAEHVYTFRRDNCQTPRFYCDPADLMCKTVLQMGARCSNDRECGSVRTPSSLSPA